MDCLAHYVHCYFVLKVLKICEKYLTWIHAMVWTSESHLVATIVRIYYHALIHNTEL